MSKATIHEHTKCAALPGTGQQTSYELARRSRSFAFAAHFFDTASKQTIGELYRYLRYIDDLVDESEDREFAFSALKALRECYLATDTTQVKVRLETLIDFVEFCTVHSMPASLITDFLGGQLSDLDGKQISTQQALLDYSYKVAGTVGLMFVWLLKTSNIATQKRAADLGIAMQLTNIARDVRDDALSGRFYLPEEMVTRETIIRAVTTGEADAVQQVNAAIAEILSTATTYYRRADSGIALLPESVRYPVLVASRLYENIGKEISQHISGADKSGPVSRRLSVSLVQKTVIALQAALELKKETFRPLLRRTNTREAES
ncbi:MAG: squalene/phytoene synthase family protein [Candidatus Obscuribacter sp.]|nr:squalene/phytoene synthase family protein [Candidatus Obscuribacter sp.]